jgi:dTDP-4-amino-4,6-dideoxygalactose transaminase
VASFERDFAGFCGTEDAIATSTGTSALHLALLAADLGPGDEVITVSLTFVATVAAILYTGAKPVLVDVDPETFTMDPLALARAITSRTKAIVPVHLHGRLADMDAISRVARYHGLVVIEDAAQAHGAERGGAAAGSFGDLGCFSFYPGKNLGACGEGGAVVTSDRRHAAAIRSLRDWGQEGRYNHVREGFNYRLDTIQAAALQVKLAHLPAWTEGRRRVAARYDAQLGRAGIRIPKPAGRDHVYHVYAVRLPDRDATQRRLGEAGIATGIHYPRPVHLQPAYGPRVALAGGCAQSEALAREFLSLPIYPEMTDEQVDMVCSTLADTTGAYDVEAA